MRSRVAEAARHQQRLENLALSVEERVELARRLGEEGIAMLMAGEHIDRDEAVARIQRMHARGRRRSVANE